MARIVGNNVFVLVEQRIQLTHSCLVPGQIFVLAERLPDGVRFYSMGGKEAYLGNRYIEDGSIRIISAHELPKKPRYPLQE
jgi:hypothetical protein